MVELPDDAKLRMGFRAAGAADVDVCLRRLKELGERGVLPGDLPEFISVLQGSAQVDAVLLAGVRIAETHPELLKAAFAAADRVAFVGVCGASDMLADYLVRYPHLLALLNAAQWESLYGAFNTGRLQDYFAQRLQLVLESPDYGVGSGLLLHREVEGLRAVYWQCLLLLVAADLGAFGPPLEVRVVSRVLAALVDVVLNFGLRFALGVNDAGEKIRFSIIAMGKTGAQELNYISDVDLLYVFAPAAGVSEAEGLRLAAAVAADLSAVSAAVGSQPVLWPIDLGLRPEGKDGVVARTLDGYRNYYQEWAQNWEFQALLKARFSAGDQLLGQQFIALVEPLVWQVSARSEFIPQLRRMRQTVEDNIPRKDASRQLKLGSGGLRDIEFSVQLLQLVHGRSDESLRERSTLAAITALTEGGYVGRAHGAELRECYRFLRVFEHQLQLLKMRRTQLVPQQQQVLDRVARGMRRFYPELADCVVLEDRWRFVKQRVRQLHEAIFYHPLVEALAESGDSFEKLSVEQAQQRLAAFGFRDPVGSLRHVQALSAGTGRTALIQRRILPAMLAWLSQGADPDQGLLNFRKLSDEIGSSHWYLRLLRDSAVAAQRLCRVLSSSSFATHCLMRFPEAVQWLAEDSLLLPREDTEVYAQAEAVLSRYDFAAVAVEKLRGLRDLEITRAALADLVLGLDVARTGGILSLVTDVCVSGALRVAQRELGVAEFSVLAVALGRYGGNELSYGSDADVMFTHSGDLIVAEAVIKRASVLLNSVSQYSAVVLDLGLRPEGKNGVLSRSLDSYVQYWRDWALSWERQALVRARLVLCGRSDAVAVEFERVLDEARWLVSFSEGDLKQIRLLKARVEAERIPRGVVPSQHLKLGPGGLSDVEWLVQVKQLSLAGAHPQLRTQSTLEALEQLQSLGVFSAGQTRILREAWLHASALRCANVLATGRILHRDVLSKQVLTARMVAVISGVSADEWQSVGEEFLKRARLARKLFTEVFYG